MLDEPKNMRYPHYPNPDGNETGRISAPGTNWMLTELTLKVGNGLEAVV